MACGKCGHKNALKGGAPPRATSRVQYCVTLPPGGKKEQECFLVLHEARRFAKKRGLKKPIRTNR